MPSGMPLPASPGTSWFWYGMGQGDGGQVDSHCSGRDRHVGAGSACPPSRPCPGLDSAGHRARWLLAWWLALASDQDPSDLTPQARRPLPSREVPGRLAGRQSRASRCSPVVRIAYPAFRGRSPVAHPKSQSSVDRALLRFRCAVMSCLLLSEPWFLRTECCQPVRLGQQVISRLCISIHQGLRRRVHGYLARERKPRR